MATAQPVYALKGKVQHYSWGGFEYIPQLLSVENTGNKPFAEYWLGAHPNQPSTIAVNGQEQSLHELIQGSQVKVLGATVAQKFGALPFLLKVLDVRQMLSIQVHPSKQSAEIGFEQENKTGIPVTAPHRNYKDENHKPELMVALSDFWLLHGFKPAALLMETLAAVPDFKFLIEVFNTGGYKGLYEKVMLMDQAEVNCILAPVVERIMPLYKNGGLPKSSESFWAARAVETFCTSGNYDRGIFSIYFFNLLHLKKGEGIYQPAQMPHAYLEGQNVEIMANSDNVLRAGLTEKYIDVAELLRHVRFEETIPTVLGSHAAVQEEIQFAAPAEEFELYQYFLDGNEIGLQSFSAEIILVLQGEAVVSAGEQSLSLSGGKAAFIPAGTSYRLFSQTTAEVFRAAVPQ